MCIKNNWSVTTSTSLKEIINRIGYFPIAFFLFSVLGIIYFFTNRVYLDKSEYYELARQLTPDKKYYIYRYARYGAAFTGDITGYRLIERDERFAENAGQKFLYSPDGWLSQDTILINMIEQGGIDADTSPAHTEYENLANFTIKRVNYNSAVRGGGYSKFICDSLYVSGGKLTILGIQDRDVKSMIFPLGAITIYPHSGIVSKIEVNSIKKWYTYDKHAMVTSESYEFVPLKSILINELGETGFFLSIK